MSSLQPAPPPPEALWLGVDGGASSLRWCVIDERGAVVRRGEDLTGGTNLHVEPAEAVLDRLLHLAARLPAGLAGVGIGSAGIDAPDDHLHFERTFRALAPALGLPPAAVHVTRDVEIIAAVDAHAALKVCVIAGTGSSAYGVRAPSGTEAWAGGLDLPLTDWGSAASIGGAALAEAVRQACRMRPVTRLGPAVFTRFGLAWPDDWRRLKPVRAMVTKPALARVALLVADCAERGDPAALRIERAAGDDLGEMVLGVLRALGARRREAAKVLCVGGVLQHNPRVRQRFEARVRARFAEVTVVDADPALGAARLARERVSRPTPPTTPP